MALIIGFTAAALATATLSAVAGMGGGIILIGLLFAMGLPPALALPLHAGVQLVSNGARATVYAADIRWPALLTFAVVALPLPFVVAPWVAAANPDLLRLIMGVFIAASAWPGWMARLRLHGRFGLLAAGAIAGVMGPLVGGVGALVAPFFMREGWRRGNVVATMACAQTGVHGAKIVAFALAGYSVAARPALLLPMAAAAALGAVIGRRVGRHVSEAGFRRLVRVILVVLACRLVVVGGAGLWAG